MSVNHVILVGRLGRDPESRFTGGGTQVANFSIATEESYKDRNGDKQKKTEWHRLIAWGKLAEIVQKYLTKGSLIYIEGTLATRKWKDKENIERYTTEITVRQLRMLGGGTRRSDDSDASAEDHTQGDHGDRYDAQRPGSDAGSGSQISDEDIPF